MTGSGEQHRSLFHHHKNPADVVVESTQVYGTETVVDGKHHAKVQIKQHAQKQHLGEAVALVGGAFALHEKHKAKKDPENAHNHRVAEAIAGAVAIGSGAYAVHERHDKKEARKAAKYHGY